MNTKLILAAVASCLAVSACAVGPNMNLKSFSLGGAQSKDPTLAGDASSRFKVMTQEPECPECCVAITGTSNNAYVIPISTEVTYNIEINTPADRVNFVQTG